MANVNRGSYKTFLAFSCVHRPVHDAEACDWLIRLVKDHKPAVLVNLGDFLDIDSLSKFTRDDGPDLATEYESADTMLAQLRDASPGSVRVWIQGNHEQRMFRPEWTKLARCVDYRTQIPEASHWKHLPYCYGPQGTYTIGQVTFSHGHYTGVSTCKKEAYMLGVENGLFVSGHTHRPHDVHRIALGTLKMRMWHVNPGTLIDLDWAKNGYMQTKDDSLWGQGVVIGAADTKRRADTKQNWEAEMILRRMAWDSQAVAA